MRKHAMLNFSFHNPFKHYTWISFSRNVVAIYNTSSAKYPRSNVFSAVEYLYRMCVWYEKEGTHSAETLETNLMVHPLIPYVCCFLESFFSILQRFQLLTRRRSSLWSINTMRTHNSLIILVWILANRTITYRDSMCRYNNEKIVSTRSG